MLAEQYAISVQLQDALRILEDVHSVASREEEYWADAEWQRLKGNLLAPVYNCLTEGFDTADLTNAKGLLEG